MGTYINTFFVCCYWGQFSDYTDHRLLRTTLSDDTPGNDYIKKVQTSHAD